MNAIYRFSSSSGSVTRLWNAIPLNIALHTSQRSLDTRVSSARLDGLDRFDFIESLNLSRTKGGKQGKGNEFDTIARAVL